MFVRMCTCVRVHACICTYVNEAVLVCLHIKHMCAYTYNMCVIDVHTYAFAGQAAAICQYDVTFSAGIRSKHEVRRGTGQSG